MWLPTLHGDGRLLSDECRSESATTAAVNVDRVLVNAADEMRVFVCWVMNVDWATKMRR